MSAPRVLVLDHRDSFVFNLVEAYLRFEAEVRVYRASLKLGELGEILASFNPHLVVLSPGPGRPESAGVSLPWMRTQPPIPVLGICLGHQIIAQAAGGVVVPAPEAVHGRASPIEFGEDPLFRDLPRPFMAARYHSLMARCLPPCLAVTARLQEGEQSLVMALRHRQRPYLGFQFHPESFLTPAGELLLERTLQEALSFQKNPLPQEPRQDHDS